MPEGHSVHRIAHQFQSDFVGQEIEISSPQGRFTPGAQLITGQRMIAATAVGKHLFLDFANDLTLRVHLGIYGAWDFAGELTRIGTDRKSTRLNSSHVAISYAVFCSKKNTYTE